MSLHAPLFSCIPNETARVAHAAFPKGNPSMRMRDTLGPISANRDVADLFPRDGAPAQAPAHLALISVMQFAENLSDRQAADAVRARIDGKYALALELTDPGFDASVLCDVRARLVAGGAEQRLFEQMLLLFKAQGLVKGKGRQRTDATHVLAAMHVLHRLECIGETVRHALTTLATSAPAWLTSWVPAEWSTRYGRRIDEYRLPEAKADRSALAEEWGTDGRELLHRLWDPATDPALRALPAVQILRLVWLQQLYAEPPAAPMRWRVAEDLPPAPQLICTPYDVDARFSKKRETSWVGSKVHLTESGDDDAPHLFTDVTTTPATTADNTMPAIIQQQLETRGLAPTEHLVDAGDVCAENLLTSQQADIDLVGPTPPEPGWRAKAKEGFAGSCFVLDWDAEQATCPQGQVSRSWTASADHEGRPSVAIRFDKSTCAACPARTPCLGNAQGPRSLLVHERAHDEALHGARTRQQTEAFKTVYADRAGIEGSLSQGVRVSGMRQSRYIGYLKTRLMHFLVAAALNFIRVAAWLAEVPQARTRTSAFARLAPAAT
ncbi:IS1182 family transposase [Candidatus Chloroploca sp. M-50]|uniref:IS1182 family transposase n=1 Tax=Candidatus Chloroploca mongolica TaxID=2528176 RepID=A0ABS4DA25_9CHLR|nr:IS1182 family transposase [Candidatus Chloroploca mongolica]MBP1466265.1 IS1182 family transposase [Candidatus Chloroploca mongolica]